MIWGLSIDCGIPEPDPKGEQFRHRMRKLTDAANEGSNERNWLSANDQLASPTAILDECATRTLCGLYNEFIFTFLMIFYFIIYYFVLPSLPLAINSWPSPPKHEWIL